MRCDVLPGKWGVPKQIDHQVVFLDGVVRLRTRFTTEGKDVIALTVQLEAFHDGEWKPVRRCDDHHGQPHVDHYNSQGVQVAKEWLDCGRNEALTRSLADFKENWEQYAAEFLDRSQ